MKKPGGGSADFAAGLLQVLRSGDLALLQVDGRSYTPAELEALQNKAVIFGAADSDTALSGLLGQNNQEKTIEVTAKCETSYGLAYDNSYRITLRQDAAAVTDAVKTLFKDLDDVTNVNHADEKFLWIYVGGSAVDKDPNSIEFVMHKADDNVVAGVGGSGLQTMLTGKTGSGSKYPNYYYMDEVHISMKKGAEATEGKAAVLVRDQTDLMSAARAIAEAWEFDINEPLVTAIDRCERNQYTGYVEYRCKTPEGLRFTQKYTIIFRNNTAGQSDVNTATFQGGATKESLTPWADYNPTGLDGMLVLQVAGPYWIAVTPDNLKSSFVIVGINDKGVRTVYYDSKKNSGPCQLTKEQLQDVVYIFVTAENGAEKKYTILYVPPT